MVVHFPVLPSRLIRMQGRIETLHRKLTKLGAREAKRPGARPPTAAHALSPLSDFDSANLAQLQVELDCLERRAESASPLPAELRRSLDKLRQHVDWLVDLLPPA